MKQIGTGIVPELPYPDVREAEAKIINAPADYPYEERKCTVEDFGTHRWIFSETIADTDPEIWGGILFES